MTDIRARLADALREHEWISPGTSALRPSFRCRCGWQSTYEGGDWHSLHVADILLSLPGIAIVELPDVGEIDAWDVEMASFADDYPERARNLAVALLAVANAPKADHG